MDPAGRIVSWIGVRVRWGGPASFRRWVTAAGLLTLTACSSGDATSSIVSTPAPTTEATSPTAPGAVADDAGDALLHTMEVAPGYLDAVGGSVEVSEDGTFVFSSELAAPMPERPQVPPPFEALGWSFCVDTDPKVAAVGFPLRSIPMPCEFIVHTRWDGSELSGLLIDRRPLADGGDAKQIPMDPVLEGSAVRELVAAGRIGDPSTFEWSMFTEELGPLGTDKENQVDMVPDGGIDSPVTWTMRPGSSST